MAATIDPARGRRIRARREQLTPTAGELAARPKGQRRGPGITPEELAARPIDTLGRACGASPADIRAYEAGIGPDDNQRLARLAEALQISWRYLATGADDAGTRITRLRLEHGLSRDELGALVEAAPRTVQAWEIDGVEPSPDKWAPLAAALETTRRYLRAGETGEDAPGDQRAADNPMRPATRGMVTELREEHGQRLEEMARELGRLSRRVRRLERDANAGRSRQVPPSTGSQ